MREQCEWTLRELQREHVRETEQSDSYRGAGALDTKTSLSLTTICWIDLLDAALYSMVISSSCIHIHPLTRDQMHQLGRVNLRRIRH